MKKLFVILFAVLSCSVMAQTSKSTIKSWFETGDKPTESQFSTFIDNAYNSVSDGKWDLTGYPSISVSPFASKAAGVFYTGTTDPTNTDRLNYDGYFHATKIYSDGAEVITSFTSPWTESGSDLYNTGKDIGIGTSTPRSILDVVGTVWIDNIRLDDTLFIGSATPNECWIEIDGSGNLKFFDQGIGIVSLSDLYTSSTSSTWTLSGTDLYPQNVSYDVGIGTSSPAGYRLNVDGTTYLNGTVLVGETMTLEEDLQLPSGTSISEFSTDGAFSGNSDNAVPTEKAIKTFVDDLWQSSGNYIYNTGDSVGINTSSPDHRFDVDGNAILSGSTRRFYWGDGDTYVGEQADDDLIVNVAGANLARFKNSTIDTIELNAPTYLGDTLYFHNADSANINYTNDTLRFEADNIKLKNGIILSEEMGLMSAKITLDSANIVDNDSLLLAPAPGAGKTIIPHRAIFWEIRNGSDYTTDPDFVISFDGVSVITWDNYNQGGARDGEYARKEGIEASTFAGNTPLYIKQTQSTSGGNNEIKVIVYYSIHEY